MKITRRQLRQLIESELYDVSSAEEIARNVGDAVDDLLAVSDEDEAAMRGVIDDLLRGWPLHLNTDHMIGQTVAELLYTKFTEQPALIRKAIAARQRGSDALWDFIISLDSE